jgi:hypothetical protein
MGGFAWLVWCALHLARPSFEQHFIVIQHLVCHYNS